MWAAGWTRRRRAHRGGARASAASRAVSRARRRRPARPAPVRRALGLFFVDCESGAARPHGDDAVSHDLGLAGAEPGRGLSAPGGRLRVAAEGTRSWWLGRSHGAQRGRAGPGLNLRLLGAPTSLADIFTALTALVAPVCRAAPTTMKTMPNQKTTLAPAQHQDAQPSQHVGRRADDRTDRTADHRRGELVPPGPGLLDADEAGRHGEVAEHHDADDDALGHDEAPVAPPGDDQRRTRTAARPTAQPHASITRR